MKVIVYPNGVIGLHPEEPNEWIYTEPEPDHREFVPSITTRPDDQPNWHDAPDYGQTIRDDLSTIGVLPNG